jgi:hypothetical protein
LGVPILRVILRKGFLPTILDLAPAMWPAAVDLP